MSNDTYVRFFVEDGTNASAVDVHNADKIYAPKGADSSISFDVFSVSGVPMDISQQTVTINIRRRPTDTVSIAKINAVTAEATPSCFGQFILPKTLWTLVSPGLYVYDVISTDLLGNKTQISEVKVFQLGV